MEYKTSSGLTKWIVILPMLSIIITAFVLVEIFLGYEKETYNENLSQIRKEVIKKSKIDAHNKVMEIKNYIQASEKLLKEESQKEVKDMVNFAINIANSAYKNRKNLSKEEIRKKIVERLRDIRFFDDESGYFFIYDMKGNSLLLPPFPTLENTNLFDLRDEKGVYNIREIIKIVKKSKEGFYEWHWYRPGGTLMTKKIGFIKAYEELGILIGTARHEEDILKSVKREIKKLLNNLSRRDNESIFAYDYSGNTIAHANQGLVGKNRWDLVVKDEHVVKNMIKGARIVDEGTFMSIPVAKNPKTGKKDDRTSFVQDISELGWVIGAGVYYQDILDEIHSQRTGLKEKLSIIIERIWYATFIFLLVMLIVTLAISFKLRKVLKDYQTSLIVKHKQTIEQKEQLVYQLEHDHLTKLPNRIMLMHQIEQAINISKRDKRELALIFIDVDRFKTINDSMGHDIGDIMLKEIANRLKNAARETDIVARFGGDEFIILLDGYKNIHDVITIVKKIQKDIKVPMSIGNSDYKITLSIGISLFPDDGKEPNTLLKNADIALYRAKDSGRDAYRFFAKHMNDAIQTRLETEKALQIACDKKEFVLHYQPLVDASSNKVVGAEALIRWQHPTRGLVYPDEFISIAEESHLIVDIGEWVIEESLRQIVQWKSKGYDIEKISINVASRQLESSELISYIKQMLKETSCEAQWVEIEVIERYVMKDTKKSIKILNRLRKMGVDIAIDDFGTGYSSLAYLKNLPVTKLKIDRAFIKNLDESFEDRAIAKTIIALGDGLLMKVLAEGVETQKQKEFLSAQGCNLMQGYLFSKPLPVEELEAYLKKGICST